MDVIDLERADREERFYRLDEEGELQLRHDVGLEQGERRRRVGPGATLDQTRMVLVLAHQVGRGRRAGQSKPMGHDRGERAPGIVVRAHDGIDTGGNRGRDDPLDLVGHVGRRDVSRRRRHHLLQFDTCVVANAQT